MKNSVLIFLLSSLFCTWVFAGTCTISWSDSQTKGQSCSAVLINSKNILTASHCFPDTINLKDGLLIGECRSENKKIQFDSVELVKNIIKMKTSKNENSEDDIAIIQLKSDFFKNTQEKISTYSSLFFDGKILKKTASCYITGQNNKMIKLPLKTHISELFKTAQGTSLILMNSLNYMTYGDSGGGLFCQSYPQAPFELLGITSKVGINKMTQKPENNIFTSLLSPQAQQFIKQNSI
jgi:Trypsin